MIRSSNNYLFFNGQCEEALHFYEKCFNGKIVTLMRFKESPEPVADFDKDKIMHAEFEAPGIYFMASDGMPNQKTVIGNNVHLALEFDTRENESTIFNVLAKEGKVTMPLQKTFWGATFGMITDKFGMHWMFNCDQK